ncbi:MAG: PIG-L family deacetylase [Dermatophilaceae bacterium]
MARFLFVHAHPDDETLATGIAMAWALREGHDVDLVTCTLGDEGEVIPPELAHLVASESDTLWAYRRGELSRAMAALAPAGSPGGRLRHTVLGDEHWSMPGEPATSDPARYRDSGMAGTPSATHPRAFVEADVSEAAVLLAAQIADGDPDVVVTYDVGGGYGHPDHIQTRRAVTAALGRLGRTGPDELFEIVTPQSWVDEDRRWLRAHVPAVDGMVVPTPGDPYAVSVVPDGWVSHSVDAPELVAVQAAALAAHRTQVTVRGGYYTLSNQVAARLSGREGYARVEPIRGRRWASLGRRPGELTRQSLTGTFRGTGPRSLSVKVGRSVGPTMGPIHDREANVDAEQ